MGGLSGQIEKGQGVERERVEAVERDGREMPLSFAQQRMWFHRAVGAWERSVSTYRWRCG